MYKLPTAIAFGVSRTLSFYKTKELFKVLKVNDGLKDKKTK